MWLGDEFHKKHTSETTTVGIHKCAAKKGSVFTDRLRGNYAALLYMDTTGKPPFKRITDHQYPFWSIAITYKEHPISERVYDLIAELK